ncbi:MAG: putative family 25 glycosyltransferase [Hyperionvirus sp.]|uniref:Putative family 25 glycosyltransferase n=1 Tax=Hyperionvirus sp. TaxID=2487770 RepID=A0A3G5AAN9_9VIRU|nr:MAG: putative family 25 glycosyltransferase [Hyperionvirus sp.]
MSEFNISTIPKESICNGTISELSIKISSNTYNSIYYENLYRGIYKNIKVIPFNKSDNNAYNIIIDNPHKDDIIDAMEISRDKSIMLKTKLENKDTAWNDPLKFLKYKNIFNCTDVIEIFNTILLERKNHIELINSQLHIYCINMLRNSGRWDRSQQEFKRNGLNVIRFEGIDGSVLSDTSKNVLIQNHSNFLNGSIGLLASSVELWKTISTQTDNKWTLIVEDDVKFHPDFLELFANNWNSVPPDAEIILFGFVHSYLEDPYDEIALSNISIPINSHIIKLCKSIPGHYAYAIKNTTASKLITYSKENPNTFSVDHFNIYAFNRPPGTDHSMIKNFYIDRSSKEENDSYLFGWVSLRAEKSTIGHYQQKMLLQGRKQRETQQYSQSYDSYVLSLKKYTTENEQLYYFDIWDELSSVAFYVNKKEDAHFAFNKLIEFAEQNIPSTIQGIKQHSERILNNIKFYDCPEIYDKFRTLCDRLRPSVSTIDMINSKFDIHCINLARSKDRWQQCETEFKKFGLNVKRFEAIDGSKIYINDLISNNIVTKALDHTARAQKGALGIIATSVELWKQISLGTNDKWSLILEDDIKFHPDFLELFNNYWESVPPDADIVLFGFQYPWACDPYDQNILSNISKPINKYISKLHTTVNGNHAYAINKNSSKKLLEHYIPVSQAIDKFPPDKFNIYIFLRPPMDKKMIDDFYIDNEMWEGNYPVSNYGLISTRSEKSTIGHLKHNYLYFIQNERNDKNYQKAYQYLMEMKKNLSIYDAYTINFTIWFELLIAAFYVNKAEGLKAFEELVKRHRTEETSEGLIKNKTTIINYIKCYELDDMELLLYPTNH